jgi:hypothetical protein
VVGDVTRAGASDGESASRTTPALLSSEEGACSWLANLNGLDAQSPADTVSYGDTVV